MFTRPLLGCLAREGSLPSACPRLCSQWCVGEASREGGEPGGALQLLAAAGRREGDGARCFANEAQERLLDC